MAEKPTQNSRIGNMQRDMDKFYLIDFKTTETHIDTYYLLNAKDTSKKMHVGIHEDGEVICNCKDYTYRCKKNNILCKHCCYILMIGMKITNKSIHGRYVNSAIYNIKKKLLIDKFTGIVETPEISAPQNGKIIIDDDCPICLMEMHENENLHRCYQCHKYFHMECITVWKNMSTAGTCPYCRSDLKLDNDDDSDKDITIRMKKIKQMVDKK